MSEIYEIMDILNQYCDCNGQDYDPTDYAIENWKRVYNANKGSTLLPAFERHPNYNGNGQIVLKENYHRMTNLGAIERFVDWMLGWSKIQYPVPEPGTRVTFIQPESESMFNAGYVDDMRNIQPDEVGVVCEREYWLTDEFARVKFPSCNCDWNFDCKYLRWDGWANPEGKHLTPEQENAIVGFYKESPEQYMPNEVVDRFNAVFPELKLHYGVKSSRVLRRICVDLGLNEKAEFNGLFTKFADGINPLDVTRWTVISVNEIDFLTMSFGNSWSSCHTIDCTNRRHMPDGYRGMYSSGTVSYMLDSTSFVVYVVDEKFDGKGRFELQPKILRQMFAYDDGTLIQSRLYPQGCDDDPEAKETRRTLRNIVQRVLSECFGFTNDWVTKHGTDEIDPYVVSNGTHYRDYECFETCTVSILRDHLENPTVVEIGHDPICPRCGMEHCNSENLLCEDCADGKRTECAECGDRFDPDDYDAVRAYDETEFCCSQCAENAGYVYCNDGEWHYRNGEVCYDEWLGEYVYDYYEDFITTEDGYTFSCPENAENGGYVYLDGENEWVLADDAHKTDDGTWVRNESEEVA